MIQGETSASVRRLLLELHPPSLPSTPVREVRAHGPIELALDSELGRRFLDRVSRDGEVATLDALRALAPSRLDAALRDMIGDTEALWRSDITIDGPEDRLLQTLHGTLNDAALREDALLAPADASGHAVRPPYSKQFGHRTPNLESRDGNESEVLKRNVRKSPSIRRLSCRRIQLLS
jgi:hypothetical protein